MEPRRSARVPPSPAATELYAPRARPAPLPRPTGKVLVVHANGKEYGRGAAGPKASNREFAFSAQDYVAMRDSGRPYSGDPRRNKLLPLPRPTYTEFINRAKTARMLDRLDFLYVSAEAPQPPAWSEFAPYERVVWCGVSFRRFARIWTPERHHFFVPHFQARVVAVLLVALRQRTQAPAGSHLGALPDELLHAIIAASTDKGDSRRDDYDDREVIESGAQHLFLPAPGSAGIRESLFDAIFGLA